MKIVTAAFPFIPAKLKLGHIASTYLPCDIQNRMNKAFGISSMSTCATDVHGTWVKRELNSFEGTLDELIDEYNRHYHEVFDYMNISFDSYTQTDDDDMQNKINLVVSNLNRKGLIFKDTAVDYQCKSCNELLPKRFRQKARTEYERGTIKIDFDDYELACAFCGAEEIMKIKNEHWFLNLDGGRRSIERLQRDQNNDNLQKLIRSFSDDLEPWNFTRLNYFGPTFPLDSSRQLYIWFESMLRYAVNPQASEYQHFFGKNIIYHHSIIWPIQLYDGLESDARIQLSPRGFMQYDNSNLSEVDETVKKYGSDYLRFYLAQKVPDSISDFKLSEEDLKHTVNRILIGKIGNFLNRTINIGKRLGVEKVSISDNYEMIQKSRERISEHLDELKTRKQTQEAINFFSNANSFIDNEEAYKRASKFNELASYFAYGKTILRPIIPHIVDSYKLFDENSILFPAGEHRISYLSKKWSHI